MDLWRAIIGLSAVGFLARFSYALARTPVLPLFALHLGAGPEAIGMVVGISTITGIFFKLPSGALSDLIGRRSTMIAGLLVFAVMPFTYLLVQDYTPLLIVRFFHGFATAVYGPVSMAVIADVAGTRRGEMLSWFSSLTITGNLMGAPVGGLLLYGLASSGAPGIEEFHAVYLLSGVLGVGSLLLGLKFLKGEDAARGGGSLRSHVRRFSSGIREVISDRRVLLASSMEGLQNMSMGALEAFLPVYAVTVAGLNEFQAGLLWGIQVLATILSKPLMGKTSDKYGRKPVIVLGMILCASSLACIPMLMSFPNLLLAAVVFGLGEAFVTSSAAALVADLCKEKHLGTAMGTFGTIFDIGHASGPIVAGVLIAPWGYGVCFTIISALLLGAIPVFLLGMKAKKREGLLKLLSERKRP
ncbi:MAG: MFS transporter [bacterium]